ncbi:ABC transporter substrate-binding protein, partial [Thermoflexus sp.]|uniref:ABC transporter substrate-binding protein n=1 Tax=Thermoflexus sp. TaxID=1969742 RepID=UPI003A101185
MSRLTRRDFLRGGAAFLGLSLLGCSRSLPLSLPATREAPTSPPQPKDERLRIGYLPITDASALLIADALGYYKAEGLQPEPPILFRGWSQIAEAFQAGQVDVIHLLMPAAVWMRYFRRFPVKVVAWNHVNGSAFTVRNTLQSLEELAGQAVAIPFWYSIHNVVLQTLLRKAKLEPVLGGTGSLNDRQVRLLVMNPPDMLPALAGGQIAGYIVADPFNALAEVKGVGRVFRFTGDVWRDHACCVVAMREEDLEERPEWAQAVIRAVVRAQLWLRANRHEAPQVLSRYLPHPVEAIAKVFNAPLEPYVAAGAIRNVQWQPRWIDFQPYPYPSYTAALVQALQQTAVEGEVEFLKGLDPTWVARDLVEDRFVRRAVEEAGGPSVFDQP